MAIDLERLEDSPHLLDILLQMEDILDALDLYVFKGWIDGELVSGPDVRRHWLDMTLRYGYEEMPDPRAIMRLHKQGIRVSFAEAAEESSKGGNGEAKIWLVDIAIPRRLVTEMNAGSLDAYDEEIDRNDVEDAQDAGMTDETAYAENPEDDMAGADMGFPGEAGGDGDAPEEDPNA